MSAIRNSEPSNAQALASAGPATEIGDGPDNKVVTTTHNRALTLGGTFTKDQLIEGVDLPLQGHAVDVDKAVVNHLHLKAVSSQSDSPIQVSMNLFENGRGVNELGWSVATHETPEAYSAVANILPHETARYDNHKVYEAGKTIDPQYFETYSGWDSSSIWNGLVDLPNSTDYMVARDHPVFNVAKANWKVLGLDVSNEGIFHGNSPYVSMNKVVVNKIIQELDDTILSRMPLTDMNNLRAHAIATNPDALVDGESYQLFAELGMNYTQRVTNPLSPDEE